MNGRGMGAVVVGWAMTIMAGPAFGQFEAQQTPQDAQQRFLLEYAQAQQPEAAQTYQRALNAYAGQYKVALDASTINDESGLALAPVDDILRAHIEIPKDSGLIVTQVKPNTPAAEAGFQVHDILVLKDGEPVNAVGVKHGVALGLLQAAQAKEGEADQPEKETATVEIRRSGKPLKLTLRKAPKRVYTLHGKLLKTETTEEYFLGVATGSVDEALRSHLDLGEGKGVVVQDVIKDTAAEKAGLKANDVLISLNGQDLAGPEDLRKVVQEVKDKAVELKLIRDGKAMTVSVTPMKRPKPSAEAGEPGATFYKWHAVPGREFALTPQPGQMVPQGVNPQAWTWWAARPDEDKKILERLDKIEKQVAEIHALLKERQK